MWNLNAFQDKGEVSEDTRLYSKITELSALATWVLNVLLMATCAPVVLYTQCKDCLVDKTVDYFCWRG